MSCVAVWRSGKELQRAAVLWEEMLHRKLSKEEKCASDSLTSFLVKKERNSSKHRYSGGDLFYLLYSKLLKMEIQKTKSIFQIHSHQRLKGNKYFHILFLAGMSFNVATL